MECFKIEGVVLETKRMYMRAWQMGDLDDFYEYAKVDGVGEAAGWVHHRDIEESKQILERFILSDESLAIVDKSSNKVIGSLGVHKQEPGMFEARGREIGYVLSKDYWGKGLMSECVGVITQYLFTMRNYDYLMAGYYTGNHKSKRVLEKNGFVDCGGKEVERPSGKHYLNFMVLKK